MNRSCWLWLVAMLTVSHPTMVHADDPLNQPETEPLAAAKSPAISSIPEIPLLTDASPLAGLPPMPDWQQTARDLRLAAEMGERVSMRLADMVQALAFHASEASRHFDPLGLKTANETIARQNQLIEQLMQAEIDRLKAENKRLRRAAKNRAQK